MKKRNIILTFGIMFISGVCWAQEKMPAALAPMGALGEFSEMEKQIIFNSLQESLSNFYLLASKKSFEAAKEKAFEEFKSIYSADISFLDVADKIYSFYQQKAATK